MRFFLTLLAVLLQSIFLYGHIVQTDTLDLLEKSIPDLNHRDLVIFDYDKTLLTVKDALLQTCGKKCLCVRLQQKAPYLSGEEIEKLISLILLQREPLVIDTRSLEIIQAMQNKGIKVIVLTALRTGRFGYIPKTEYWRLQELNAHGYDFHYAFPDIDFLEFNEYTHEPNPPVLVEGLFCAGSVSKGEALYTFFMKTGYRPRRVIFVDNAAGHHDSVEKWVRRMKIPYLGYHYSGVLKTRKKVNEQIADFQVDYLIQNQQWLSDDEAAHLIYYGE